MVFVFPCLIYFILPQRPIHVVVNGRISIANCKIQDTVNIYIYIYIYYDHKSLINIQHLT